VKLQFDSFRE